jgi:ribonuclease D
MSQPPSFSGPRRTRRHPRLDYRSRSHDSAHANGGADPAEIPVHPLIPRNLADVIVTPQGLTELVARLRAAGSFAYDSEFIGELSYHPKLCLIQVATSERVSLIDTLAELDLSEFWALTADNTIEKIVHAGQQDLEPVYRLSGKPPANIFDVQVAAGFTGLSYPCGLSKLVKELVGVRLGKGFTFTHWDRRPPLGRAALLRGRRRTLPAGAAADHRRRLEQLGHLQWAKQECATLCDVAQASADPAAALLRIRGAASLSPQEWPSCASWRDGANRRRGAAIPRPEAI